MDPITLIVAALAAGVSTGVQDLAADGIRNAYNTLRDLIKRRFADERAGVSGVEPTTVLDAHAKDPKTWEAPLVEALRGARADGDAAIVLAATELLRQADPEGTGQGKYVVDARGAQGVQIGDHGTMRLTFDSPRPDPQTGAE